MHHSFEDQVLTSEVVEAVCWRKLFVVSEYTYDVDKDVRSYDN